LPSQHKTPLLGWHPPAELSEWVRREAAERGISIADLLSEMVRAYIRASHENAQAKEDKS
jgi:hypothetical protein